MKNLLWLLSSIALINGCGNSTKIDTQKKSEPYSVKCRLISEPSNLNSILANDPMKTVILPYLNPGLITIDFKTLDWTPVVAAELPESKILPDGRQIISVKIRPQARWDDNTPVTAKDIEFTLKTILNPGIQSGSFRGFLSSLDSFALDPADPLRYSMIFKEYYFIADRIAADMDPIPAHIWDSNHALDSVSLLSMIRNNSTKKELNILSTFAAKFMEKSADRTFMHGCGPYKLEKWDAGQRITLTKKDNWWGDSLSGQSVLFQAYPTKIIFEIIKDNQTAIAALKSGDIDVMYGIDPLTFTKDLPASAAFTDNFNTFTPNLMSYQSIGINTKNPILSDTSVRKALACMVNIPDMIKVACFGLGKPSATYVHPDNNKWRNTLLNPADFNPEMAKKILSTSGWADSDGDGILDKNIKGRKTKFSLSIIFNNTNATREKIANMYADELKKNGIEAKLESVDLPVMITRMTSHSYDLYVGGLASSVTEPDPYQLWHTASYATGSNLSGFGNAASDEVINQIRKESDPKKRHELQKQLQKMVHDAVPVIYILNEKERIAINKKFDNVVVSDQRPGFWLGSLTLK